jgi:ribose 5-phosphate isomerase A
MNAKQRAAHAALDYVQSNSVIGLGSGSTAECFLHELAGALKSGRLANITGVPTSGKTAQLAGELGIPLTTLSQASRLAVTIDGADEVTPKLELIKGGGGALLREKIVAGASARMVVIADESKWVATLGRFPLPIEVVPFGLATTRAAIEAAAAAAGCPGPALLRRTKDGLPLVTDCGHWILDAALGRIADPAALADRLARIAGVVEHGLFIGLAQTAILASPEGVRVVGKPAANQMDQHA